MRIAYKESHSVRLPHTTARLCVYRGDDSRTVVVVQFPDTTTVSATVPRFGVDRTFNAFERFLEGTPPENIAELLRNPEWFDRHQASAIVEVFGK